MSIGPPKFTREEIAQRGDEIYARLVKAHVEPALYGKVVAIDVISEAYEIGDTAWAASEKLRNKAQNAEIWLVRVGEPVFDRIGFVPQDRNS